LKRDTFRRPPGVGGRALLKKDAIPTIFQSFPHYLQTPEPKERRKLQRNEPSSIIPSENTVTEPTTDTPKQRGRPIEDPAVRIPKLKKKINTLRRSVSRLQNKARIQRNLLQILQKENKIQNTQLSALDGCLGELVKNQAVNKTRKTVRQ
jgi:hypothetical protein